MGEVTCIWPVRMVKRRRHRVTEMTVNSVTVRAISVAYLHVRLLRSKGEGGGRKRKLLEAFS